MAVPEAFPETVWSHIRQARSGAAGLNDLLQRYRRPIVAFARLNGFPEDRAEDVAQEVLLRVGRPDFLDKANREKGRFRSLVLAVTRHVMSEERRRQGAAKRGAGAELHTHELDAGFWDRIAGESDEAFDRAWVTEIVDDALCGLEAYARKRGLPYAEAFRLKYLEGRTQEEVAARLGCSISDAKNYVYYGKLRFKQLVLGAIRLYCSSADEFGAELAALARFLKVEVA